MYSKRRLLRIKLYLTKYLSQKHHIIKSDKMKIQVYMTQNCPKCTAFGKNLEEAIKELEFKGMIKYLNLEEAREIGLTSCPAIILNDEIKSMGKLLSIDELKAILKGSN